MLQILDSGSGEVWNLDSAPESGFCLDDALKIRFWVWILDSALESGFCLWKRRETGVCSKIQSLLQTQILFIHSREPLTGSDSGFCYRFWISDFAL